MRALGKGLPPARATQTVVPQVFPTCVRPSLQFGCKLCDPIVVVDEFIFVDIGVIDTVNMVFLQGCVICLWTTKIMMSASRFV